MNSLLSQCVALDDECEIWKAHWKLGMLSRLLSHDVDGAVRLYQRCIQVCTDRGQRCAEAYAYLALEQFLAGNVDEAVENAQAAHGQRESNVVACYEIGRAHV